ncbi:phage antirepressor KilAC domain-containing protein [Bacillus tropicus]|uniref:phage antirepressor KilAC domain-containing protein n=1 Tax=Bacillus tropicus TaxID=2026188 RepID=UPI001E29690D
MKNLLMESTNDVRTNILMAADFLKEQKRLLKKQSNVMQKHKEEKEEKAERLTKNSEEIELKGQERELLIKKVENLLKVRLEKDVVLVEAGHDSNRYVRCIYRQNRTTLKGFLEDLVAVYGDGLAEEMRTNPVQSLLQLLHEKKVLKKDYKPYSTSFSKGYFEEKPVRIYVDSNKNAIRIETEVYITASGTNRLRLKELKPIIVAGNSI